MLVAIAEYPSLTNRTARKSCAEQVGQTSAAPQPILIDRFEAQWIQTRFDHDVALYSSLSSIGQCHHGSRFAPLPIPDFRHVLTVLVDVVLVLDELVLHHLLQV